MVADSGVRARLTDGPAASAAGAGPMTTTLKTTAAASTNRID